MYTDIRLIELQFLELISKWTFTEPSKVLFLNGEDLKGLGLRQQHLQEMIVSLLESDSIRFRSGDDAATFVEILRREYHGARIGHVGHPHEWDRPRSTLEDRLRDSGHQLRITFTGMQRIEALRDLLMADHTLDPFGIVLDFRYYMRDLTLCISREDVQAIGVIALDLDDFGPINKRCGHAAGDEVIKGYLRIVKESVDIRGDVYRRGGDEVRIILPDASEKDCKDLAESIRGAVEAMRISHKGKALPKVTVSIGTACTPPETKSRELDEIADSRQRMAKVSGKNRVVSDGAGAPSS